MGKIAQLFSKKQKINEKVKCNAITQSIIDKVGCPYQVFFSDTEHSKVIEEYERQLERGKRQGFVPVLVPSDNYLDEWLDVMKEDGYSKEELLSSEVLDGEEILNKRYQDYMSNYEEDIFEHEEWNEQIEEGAYNNCLSSFIEYNSDKIKETILFKIPVTYPWQVMHGFLWVE